MDVLKELKSSFLALVEEKYDVKIDEKLINIEKSPNPEFGDLGIGCFPLAKELRMSPVKIAADLESMTDNIKYAKSLKAVGPYLNIKLDSDSFIKSICENVSAQNDEYGKSDYGIDKNIMVEYSAPNTNKPQHLGHVRNNVLGMSVSNLLENAGYNVLRVNLVNDRGIHICKSMLAYQEWGDGKTPESENTKGDHFVGEYYVRFEKELQKDESLIDKAQEMLVKWENGDKEVVELWARMNSWVMDGFKKTYDRMGCVFDTIYFESKTYKLGKDKVLDSLDKGFVRKKDSGEIVIDLEGFDTDEKVLLRADGTSIYITQDIGTTVMKFDGVALEKSIFVVASEQNYHFKVLFHVLKKMGYEWADNLYHLSYGMVYLPEGKMKSREGKVVDADNLMDELTNLAKSEIKKRAREMDEDELTNVSENVGVGALKYYILKVNPAKDMNFNPAESVSFEGSTGPYAQYSYARLSSILDKGKEAFKEKPDYSSLGNNEEIILAILISQYPSFTLDAALNYNPSKIATWIFEMAKAINKFHHDHSVLKAETSGLISARGQLISASRQTLGNALKLLGITPLSRM